MWLAFSNDTKQNLTLISDGQESLTATLNVLRKKLQLHVVEIIGEQTFISRLKMSKMGNVLAHAAVSLEKHKDTRNVWWTYVHVHCMLSILHQSAMTGLSELKGECNLSNREGNSNSEYGIFSTSTVFMYLLSKPAGGDEKLYTAGLSLLWHEGKIAFLHLGNNFTK